MTELVSWYRVLIRTELTATAAYRAQIVVGALGWIIPFVMLALWRTAAGDGEISGISAPQFTTYFVVVLVTSSAEVMARVTFSVGGMIHTGRLSVLLLRPFNPFHEVVARQLAQNVLSVPVIVVVGAIVGLLAGAHFTSDPNAIVAAVVLACIGTVSTAYLGAIVACLAFWITRAEGLQSLLFGAEWVLGGIIGPALLLPSALGWLAAYNPIYLAIGGPAQLLADIDGGTSPWLMVTISAAWLAALHIGFRVVWRRAVVRHEAVGT